MPDPKDPAPNPQPEPTPQDPKTPRPSEPTPPAPPVDPEAIRKAAKEEARREWEAEREKQRKEDEAKAAREQGKFRELYEAEQAAAVKAKEEADAARLELRRERVNLRLRDYLLANHSDYAAAAKYMVPLLTIDAKTDDAEADRQIKAVAEQYVKDNPRSAKGGGAPASPPHGQRLPSDQRPKTNGRPREETVAASRF